MTLDQDILLFDFTDRCLFEVTGQELPRLLFYHPNILQRNHVVDTDELVIDSVELDNHREYQAEDNHHAQQPEPQQHLSVPHIVIEQILEEGIDIHLVSDGSVIESCHSVLFNLN